MDSLEQLIVLIGVFLQLKQLICCIMRVVGIKSCLKTIDVLVKQKHKLISNKIIHVKVV